MHYPTDIVAGAIFGAGSAWITSKVDNCFKKKGGNKKLIGLYYIFIMLTILILERAIKTKNGKKRSC